MVADGLNGEQFHCGAMRFLLRGRAEPLLHLLMIYQTGLLKDWPPAREHDEVGYAADLEAGRELRIGLGVDL